MTAPVTLPLFRRRSASAGAAVAMLALALTGCGGADDPDTGAPVSTESASADESPTPGGSEGSTGSASAPKTPGASPEASGGQFVPASSEGPAQNVPVPEMPAVAKERTQEGLEAALEYWWATNFYLKTTGDVAPLQSVSTESCGVCQSQIKRWPAVYEDEAWVVTEPAEVSFDLTNVDAGGTAGTSLFLVSESPGELYLKDGEKVDEASGNGSEEQPWAASAIFDSDTNRWRVDDIRTQD